MSPGFTRIIEPATIISIMLILEDGQVAFGDCADVILAGVAGRDPAFNARDHIDYVRGEIADTLRGRDVAIFKAQAEAMDQYTRGGARLLTAIRYGISQALLHATALSHKQTMAEVIAREYGCTIATAPIPILASCHKDDHRGRALLQIQWHGRMPGGTANETDHSTRISTHMGLACQPDFMLSKPGLGADEALMIQTNEMARTLALLQARR